MKFVDPKTDIAFKKIFGNEAHKNILKETTLDVKATDKLKREFIVEMQVEKETTFAKRAIYYSSKAYSQQLKKAQKYHLLKPVIFLGILDFNMFEHDEVISRHLILNKKTMQHDLKDLEFNFIELQKFTKSESELETVAEKWIYFLQHADDLDRVPENANTPALQEAYEVAAQHTWTREELDIYEAQEFKIAVNENVMETARMEAKLEGKLEEKFAIAKNLLATGLDIETISKVTGLTQTEIKNCR